MGRDLYEYSQSCALKCFAPSSNTLCRVKIMFTATGFNSNPINFTMAYTPR
jgi:hypothetical protein